MRVQSNLFAVLALAVGAVFALTATTPAQASEWNQKTVLTVNETIEVPGAILDPGTYVVKLVDSDATRHIVQFLNEREDEVLSTVIAVPNRRLEVTGDTEFAWYETPANQPPALRAWFYPGRAIGQEFVYDEFRGAELAAAAKRNVMTTKERFGADDDDLAVYRSTEIYAVTPTKEKTDTETAAATNMKADQEQPMRRTADVTSKSTTTEASNQRQTYEPTQVAQANQRQQSTNRPMSSVEDNDELPETAGPAPLLALLGLVSLGSGLLIRKVRS